MKNQSILALAIMMVLAFRNEAQVFKTSLSLQDDPMKPITHVAASELNSDDFDISIYLAAAQETINDIGTFKLEEVFYINGEKANTERLWSSYDKSSDARSGEEFLVSPSLKFDMSMEAVIEANSDLVKEKANKLKIEFIHSDDQRVLGTCEFTFDVPGMNNYESDFCDLYDIRNTDEKVEATLHAMFKLMYPHEEIVETLCLNEWGDFKGFDGELQGENNSYMLIFKNKGKLWKLRYSAEYVLEDGEILEKPRVKIYNGLSDPAPVNQTCLTSLQNSLN